MFFPEPADLTAIRDFAGPEMHTKKSNIYE